MLRYAKVEVTCAHCSQVFKLSKQEHARRLQQGKLYCSKKSCSPTPKQSKRKMISVCCAQCQTVFIIKMTDFNQRVGRIQARGGEGKLYCNRKCSAIAKHPVGSLAYGVKLQRFDCKCGAEFYLLPSTARKRLRWLAAFGGELYCSRLCAVNFSPTGTWPTFVKAYDEMEEQAAWERTLIEAGLSMNRGIHAGLYYGQEPWDNDPSKQRQFSYSS